MSNTYNTPTLYGHSSKGDVKTWKGSVTDEGDKSVITFEFGLEHGKKQIQIKDITEGKNIGKINETTPFEQAVKDVKSKMNKKIDEGYGEDKFNIPRPILPMLAHRFDKRKHNIKYPCYIQPKIDGVRMTCRMIDGKIEMFTRKGKSFTVMNHLEKEILNFINQLDLVHSNPHFYLDGELYSDSLTFQELAGVIRNSESSEEQLKEVNYVIFDCFLMTDLDIPFYIRFGGIKQSGLPVLKENNNPTLTYIDTIKISDETEVYEWNNTFVQKGYEGVIIRNLDGGYVLKNRSPNLQKFKTFLDDEFKVIGFTEGTGTDKGCVIWECETNDGKVFSVRPQGTVLERQGYFQNGDNWIDSQLTVRYQELTDDGIPRFPVGITIRNYE